MTRHSIPYYVLAVVLTLCAPTTRAQGDILQFVFTSDVHYGVTRPHFRGSDSVPATLVNRAMIAAINRLPQLAIPRDRGVGSGQTIDAIDAIVITGDIANREETGIQPAAASWRQFEADYGHRVTTRDRDHRPTALWLCAGNHDVSNTIGYWKPTEPATDPSSMVAIYNRMMSPSHPRTVANYNYTTDKVHYSKDIGGIHLLFVNLWPDSAEQQWMEQDLKGLRAGTPVLLFTHSNPDVEARFFTNPNGKHTIDSADKFENLLPETFRDGQTVRDSALYEQRGLAAFLKRHPEIRAYFHGHNNFTEFYDWQVPDMGVALPCFRVDSPMKGRFSAKDETLLSFQLISIDTRTKTMTVRECRWNSVPDNPSILKWGDHMTMALH
jgi:hypothetical protein